MYSAPTVCHRNGHWKWFDAVDVLPEFLPRLLSLINIQCAEEFWPCAHDNENLTNNRYEPLNITEGSFSPSDPLLLCTCLPARSLTSFGSTTARVNSAWYCLLRPNREVYIMPCFGSFQRKCLPSFSVPLFVFFLLLALLFVQNVSLSWWMYCAVTTYLPALVWICCFYVWVGKKGQGDRNPGLKKTKEKD